MKNATQAEEGKVSLTSTSDEVDIVAEPAVGEPMCPHKDLNLPRSYDEVVERMKRLQSSREDSAMN